MHSTNKDLRPKGVDCSFGVRARAPKESTDRHVVLLPSSLLSGKLLLVWAG